MDNLSEMLKGVLEGMMLQVIGQGEVYGYQIVQRLKGLGLDGIAEGTVYTVLARIERKRLVSIERRQSTIGPPRKFYSLNSRGRQELADFWLRWDYLATHIDALRNGEDHDIG
jgi:PadR family transcriptional regulator PadR